MSEAQSPPPDLMEHTKKVMAQRAEEQAAGWLERKARGELKKYVPKILHPLIPGERGTVEGNLKKEASKQIWAWIGGLLFSLFFFAAVAAVLLFVVLIIAWALIFG